MPRVPDPGMCVYTHWETLSCQDEAESERWVSAVKKRARVWRQRPLELGGPTDLTQPEQKEVRYPNDSGNWRWRSNGPVMKSTGPSRSQLNLSSSTNHTIRKGQASEHPSSWESLTVDKLQPCLCPFS
ncbi:rCG32071 [Rattus norvegicus]|uniref:RCG32071 n=1 Tax=Rattus norvegicus TaxID=10116 RepID=A6JXI8_RAT|nr:rCG32071 [Rattus norvegicus]